MEVINIDRGSQQKVNTENLCLNVIITHSRFISLFICLFSTIVPIYSPSFSLLYKDDTGRSAVEINACSLHQSSVKIVKLKSTGNSVTISVILHDKLTNQESKFSDTFRAYTLDQRGFNISECTAHAHFSTWLNFS